MNGLRLRERLREVTTIGRSKTTTTMTMTMTEILEEREKPEGLKIGMIHLNG